LFGTLMMVHSRLSWLGLKVFLLGDVTELSPHMCQ